MIEFLSKKRKIRFQERKVIVQADMTTVKSQECEAQRQGAVGFYISAARCQKFELRRLRNCAIIGQGPLCRLSASSR